MWAQLITMPLKPGKEDDLPALFDQLKAVEQPDSGLLRTLALRDQKDPTQLRILVLFESEEKARAREEDERRNEGLGVVRSMMADMLGGPPEFADLDVIADFGP